MGNQASRVRADYGSDALATGCTIAPPENEDAYTFVNSHRYPRTSCAEPSLPIPIPKSANPADAKHSVSSLDWKDRGIAELSADIGSYRSLLIMDVSGNQLYGLPSEVGNLRKLRRLALGKNCLQSLPAEIGRLCDLQWLDLTYNHLGELPDALADCKRLCSLGASECRFPEFPAVLCRMPALAKLGCFNNLISCVPPQIGNLRSLVKLDLSGNMIRELPDEFCKLTNLTWLNLSSNQLVRLPKDLGRLVNLTEIGLAHNKLRTLPNLGGLKQLKVLPVYGNELEEVSEWVGEMSSLERLDLSSNKLVAIPASIFSCPKLNTLIIRHNQIVSLPDLENPTCTIAHIDLRDNQLTSVPQWLMHNGMIDLKAVQNPWLHPDEVPVVSLTVPELSHLLFNRSLTWMPKADLTAAFADLPTTARVNLLHSTHKCDACGKPFAGHPLNFVDFRVVSDMLDVPAVMKLCGSACMVKKHRQASRRHLEVRELQSQLEQQIAMREIEERTLRGDFFEQAVDLAMEGRTDGRYTRAGR